MTTGAQTQPPPPVTPSPDDARRIRHLMFYFGMVFVVEGIGQTDGIIAQPLIYYFKEVHSWTPVQVAAALTAFNFPWIIKPIYGLVSDFVPLFGYRRKSYLVLASLVTTGAYLLAAHTEASGRLLFVLLLTAYGMAIASTLCGALLVENGQRYAQRSVREPAVAMVPHRGDELVADRRPAGTEIVTGRRPAWRGADRGDRAADDRVRHMVSGPGGETASRPSRTQARGTQPARELTSSHFRSDRGAYQFLSIVRKGLSDGFPTSALGQKQTHALQQRMSALGQ